MKLADYILLAVIAACLAAALAFTIRRRKNGGCMGCGSEGHSSGCGSSCQGCTGCSSYGSCGKSKG